jgi:multidrug efflux pump subunit AcrB
MDMTDFPRPGAGRLRPPGRRLPVHALTPLLALVALLLGLFAVLVTPREEEPQINVTMASVLIPFPGAASADVQNLVARPAEQVLSQIAGIEHTYSVSRPGVAMLTVQFQVGVPRTEALVRLYDVLNANQDWLPAGLGVLTPIVRPKGIDDVPVLAVTLWSRDATSALDLERVAHTMEAELKRVPGAREVRPSAAPAAWCRSRSTPAGCASAASTCCACSRRWPPPTSACPRAAWSTRRAGRMLAVETGEFLRDADEVGDLVVGVQPGQAGLPARGGTRRGRRGAAAALCLVHARRGGAAAAAPVRLAGAAGAVYPAVTLTVTKKPGENAVDVAAARASASTRCATPSSRPASRPRSRATTAPPPPTRPTS